MLLGSLRETGKILDVGLPERSGKNNLAKRIVMSICNVWICGFQIS